MENEQSPAGNLTHELVEEPELQLLEEAITRVQRKPPTSSQRSSNETMIEDPTLEENSQALSETLAQALEWGRSEGITFDPDKSELLHFSRKRSDIGKSPAVRAGALMVRENPERPYLKWLGVLFDRKLTFKYHVQAQSAKAMKTARAFFSLGNTLRGVSASLIHQAVTACVLPIAYFAAETW